MWGTGKVGVFSKCALVLLLQEPFFIFCCKLTLCFVSRDETCNLFTAASIDASSYTHIVFSFASISADGMLEPWEFESDIKGGQYQQFIDVKKRFPETKTIISVGGWTHNDPDNERLYRFSNVAATPISRMKFSQSSVAFMRKYGFDG